MGNLMPFAVLARRPSAADPPPLADNTRQAILADLERPDALPVLSATAARAVALLADPEVSPAELATLIRRDGVLAAAVLRRANSALYGGRRRVEDVHQAVVRLGVGECGRIVCAIGTRGVYDRVPAAARARCDGVHRHSLFVANLAAELARAAGRGTGGPEFAAGLLHDVGRLVILARSPDADLGDDAPDLPARERDELGIDHCAVGYQFAVKSGLPEGATRAILNHHRPDEEQLHQGLVGLVAAANGVAVHVERERNLTGYDPDACPGFEVFEWGVEVDRRPAVRAALPGVVVHALKETRAMLRACG